MRDGEAVADHFDLPDDLDPDPDGARRLIEAWEARRPSPAYIELLAFAESWIEWTDELPTPEGVLEGLPAPIPDEEDRVHLGKASGFIATTCPDAGDGEDHDTPGWRPYLTGNRWDPQGRAWDASQTRGKTARERWERMSLATDAPRTPHHVEQEGTPLGILKFEFTLPPGLVARVWGEIVEDGAPEFSRLGDRMARRAWQLFGLPGKPVGTWVNVHRSSSSKPHEIRPHLHVWVPAIYRDHNGNLEFVSKLDGNPLYVDKDILDGPLQEAWASELGNEYGFERETPENAHYSYLWVDDAKDRARMIHGTRYNTRPHLEDVNERVKVAKEKSVTLDVRSNPAIPSDVLHVETKEFLAGLLTIQALTPKGWQQSRWYGELSHRTFEAFAQELGAPNPEDEENTWGELLAEGRAWATGHEDREGDQAIQDVRDPIEHHALAAAIEIVPELDPPTPKLIDALTWRIEEMVEYVTLPLARLCSCCGAPLDVGSASVDELVEAYQDAQAESPFDPEDDPNEKTKTQRLGEIDEEHQREYAHKVHHERVKARTDGEIA